jgi:nucleoside-diphosphate-sugar epimerase
MRVFVRTEGTDHLLSAGQAVGVRRFVAQSHIASYARTGAAVKSEEDPFDPSPARQMGANLEGMRHVETAVLGAGWTEGIVLRCGWFCGPGTSLSPGSEQLPAPVAEWLPALADQLGAKKPMRVPRFVGRLFAGEAGVVMMTELRGASNAKAKQELAWRPAHPSWRQGLAAA